MNELSDLKGASPKGSSQLTVCGSVEDGEVKPDVTCCLGLSPPSILLRNIILPRDLWSEFPRGLTFSISDYFVYQPQYPQRDDESSILKPSLFDMEYEQVWITTKDKLRLYAFLIKAEGEDSKRRPTLVFFHGNAGSIGDRLDNAKLLHSKCQLNILMVEYRGYGPSEGVPSEKGLYRDAKAAFSYIEGREDLDSKQIFVFGRSLGGAVAIDLCSRKGIRNRVAGLICENTFTSIPGLAKKIFEFPGVKYLPNFFYSNKYDSKGKVCGVKCPSLFINSLNDELIPGDMMPKLHKGCGAKKKDLVNIWAGHNDAYLDTGYAYVIQSFMEQREETV